MSSAQRVSKAAASDLRLYDASNPLRAAGKTRPELLLVPVDQELNPRVAGVKLPKLPAIFQGKSGERAEFTLNGIRAIAIGTGMAPPASEESAYWESVGAAVIDSLRALRIESASLAGNIRPVAMDAAEAACSFALGATLASCNFVRYRKLPPKSHFEIKSLALSALDWKASTRGRELGDAINWTRVLTHAPANLLHPQSFATELQSLKNYGVDVQVINATELKRMGAGGLLAVGRGSVNPPCMVVCRWQGKKGSANDLGLVGKGVTFDAGGLNLKPGASGISRMKTDMAGAAAVAGAMRVLASRKAPVNVVAVLPICENLIDADAFRPGDVITSLSGLTIEVDNTDAEGRIILADAVTHIIDNYKPRVLVDVATLTGAIVVALMEEYAGLFSNDDGLAKALDDAGNRCGDLLWRMPLTKRYDYLVDSDIADVKNVGAIGLMGAGAGSVAAAKFIERFVGSDTRWAHLDIAGTAWITRPWPGIAKGPSGFGVRLLSSLAESLPQ